MLRKQILLLLGAAPAAFVVIAVWRAAPEFFGPASLPTDDTASRLAFAARWLLLPGVTLMAGIVAVGRRGFLPEAVDGTRTPANHGLEIDLRYNQNTLEQTVLAAIAWSGLALALPHPRLVLIPAMAGLFLIGRIAFWIGYRLDPLGRAFGMVLTVLPTLGAYVWLVARVLGAHPASP
jgi:hypothetical protein